MGRNILAINGIYFLALFSYLFLSFPAMSYEEPNYKIVKMTDVYEVRRYEKRAVAQVTLGTEDSGFRILFNYISGANTKSQEVRMTVPVTESKLIDMTAPVTETAHNGKMVMQFFLPSQYSKQNAPTPNDRRVQIVDLPEEHFAVISYSGFNSEKNFRKHQLELEQEIKKDGLHTIGAPIKATYNSPFTPPFLRRNEVMYLINWD